MTIAPCSATIYQKEDNTVLEKSKEGTLLNGNNLQYRVGFLGCPPRPDTPWTQQNLERLKDLGLNTIQINIAWGYRPGDEPLNLEDLIDVPPHLAGEVEPASEPSPHRRQQRRQDVTDRSRLCKKLGLRTIFHFGAPYVRDINGRDYPPNCLLDGKTTPRYLYLLDAFAQQFPDVDDILIYTYDQHAWLCSEFGHCPCCMGIPLHERIVPFLEQMKAIWRQHRPDGRLWWKPWELSAGQVQQCIILLKPEGLGLALHSNIAEVMATLPVDRWLKNCCNLASKRGIPVIVEYWLGGPSEELEPYLYLSHPLVTLRGLKTIAAVPGACGIKEYFGLIPDKEDPNLRMTGLFLAKQDIDEDEAITILAQPYGRAAKGVTQFWRLTSQGMELFPWDASWLIREIGRSDPIHSMSAAYVRGVPWHTPSWMSTRRAIFMKVDDSEPDPWMLEDIQLRCQLAADCMNEALTVGRVAISEIDDSTLAKNFQKNLEELMEMRRRILSYSYHIRETNLVKTIRNCRKNNHPVPQRTVDELLAVLKADQENQEQDQPMDDAIRILKTDLDTFLDKYFKVVPDQHSKGYFSLTSR